MLMSVDLLLYSYRTGLPIGIPRLSSKGPAAYFIKARKMGGIVFSRRCAIPVRDCGVCSSNRAPIRSPST